MWSNYYEDTLLEWNKLRAAAMAVDLEPALHMVNDWWARAPLSSHYLHPADYTEWPSPWDLLADNTYCELAKCLGIVYTLILLDRDDITSLHIILQDNYYAVSVNNEQFILNDQPGEITGGARDTEIEWSLDCDYFKEKII
jgi:hypothetical protein